MPDPDADARAAFLGRLIDDAGLFPPARLPMAEAVAGHARAARGRFAWIQGRFLCPASRLGELAATLAGDPDAGGAVRTVGVILDRQGSGDWESGDWESGVAADLDTVAAFQRASPGAVVDVVETRLPAGADLATAGELAEALAHRLPPGVTPFLEVPDGDPALVKAIAGVRAHLSGPSAPGAKIRCGGVSADAFPTPGQVAAFLAACGSHGVPAKATAGLHHPVRHRDDAHGWDEHGFLNVVGAAVLAAGGEPEPALARLLAEDDPRALQLGPDGFSWRGRQSDRAAIAAGRALLRSYGSCSFEEPVQGLVDLGVLA